MEQNVEKLDALIIGTGVTGIYALHRLRELGLTVRAFEKGDSVGGVWYWNRYPGCRFDTWSPEYMFSFSPELFQEWDWRESFSPQPDNERYLNFVADKCDLRKYVQFNTTVRSMVWDEDARRWLVTTQDGAQVLARFVVAAVGRYNTSYSPDFPGLGEFKGTWLHTGRWPKDSVDLAGRHVGVIGTGATGVQVIPAVAKVASRVVVFQRTAGFCIPMGNRPIEPDEMDRIKAKYPEIFRRSLETPHFWLDRPMSRSGLEFTRERRLRMYEDAWPLPGTSKYQVLFREVGKPGPLNEEYSEFVQRKIREQIKDPKVAEKLVPRDHPFRSKRIPRADGYYESFNNDNVDLVCVKEDPIERFTATGIKTRSVEYPLDVVIFATGWDVVTGPLLAIDIRGEGGKPLTDHFANGFRAFMQLQAVGFPNLFFLNAAARGSYVRSCELVIDWVGQALRDVLGRGYTRMAPRLEAEDAWVQRIIDALPNPLRAKANSGITKLAFVKSSGTPDSGNITGKPRIPLATVGSTELDNHRRRTAEASDGYPSFSLS